MQERINRGQGATSGRRVRPAHLLAGFAGISWAASGLAATVTTWTGAMDNNFNNTSNWSAGLAATAPFDDSDFNLAPSNYANHAPTLSATITVNGLIFDAPGWTVGGSSALTLANNGDGVVDDSSTGGGVTISAPVVLGGGASNSTGFNISSGDTVTLSGVVSGSSVKLSSTGPGTLTLNGSSNNTYGDLVASSGTVNLDMSGGALSAAGNLDLSATANAVFQASSQLTTSKAFRVEDAGSVNLAGFSQTLNNVSFRTNASDGLGTGAGAVNLNGGTLTLSGTAPSIVTQNNGNTTAAVISSNGNSSSALVLGNATTITASNVTAAVDLSITANISGANSITLNGLGVTSFSGANTYSGTTTVSNGALELNFAASGAPASNIINNSANSSALAMSGGTLEVLGGAGGANTQQFNGLTVGGAAGSEIQLVTNATPNNLLVSLGAIARTASNGSTIDFELPAGNQTALNGVTTSTLNTSGILGAYATVGQDDWATNSGNVSGGNIVAFTAYNTTFPTSGGNGSTNYSLTGNGSVSNAESINTLKLSNSANNQSLILSGNLTTKGLLYVGGFDQYTISGASALTDGTTNELIVNAASGNLIVSTPVVSTTATAGVLTKAGDGTLTLTGNSAYTGKTFIDGGTLALSNANTTTPLGNTQIEANAGTTLSILKGNGSLNLGNNGTSGAGGLLSLNTGSTFSMADGGVGVFNLVQNSSDTSTPLTINTANFDFDLSSAGADDLVISGNSSKGVSLVGTNTIEITAIGASLATGPTNYTLIDDSAGTGFANASGTLGTFVLVNSSITLGGQVYDLSLGSSTSKQEILTVTAVPEPASAGPLAIGGIAMLARRRKGSARSR
jgi:fibronectin-binding autotransporter adhesin